MAYIGNIPADKYQTLQKQSFTTSATDTYTLSYSVTNPQDLGLFINNVRQNPNDAYTVSGTTLTLSSAITSSDSMYAVFLGRAVETVAPAIGSVTNSMLSGSIANSKLANSSVTVNGTSISLGASGNISAGITMADMWRLTTTFSGSQEPINANWERVDTHGFGQLGTGMTESSGIFTFPSTGIYNLKFYATLDEQGGGNSNEINAKIQHTTDNSSYNDTSNGATMLFTTPSNGTMTAVAESIFDVTSTSTHKVRFAVTGNGTGSRVIGNSNTNQTYAVLIRLGDT